MIKVTIDTQSTKKEGLAMRSILIYGQGVNEALAQHQYPKDANGIEIRPGYRPPFNSQSARMAAQKSASVRRRLTLLDKLEKENRVAIDVLKQVHSLLLNRPKRGSKPHLQKSEPQFKTMVRPIRASDTNASEGKLGGKVEPISVVDSPKDGGNGHKATSP